MIDEETKQEIEMKKKSMEEWKRLRDFTYDQFKVLNEAYEAFSKKIADGEKWLFTHEPKTIKLTFFFEPELPADEDGNGEPAYWGFDFENGPSFPSEREDLLAQALGYEDEYAMWKALGVKTVEDARQKDGDEYEATFNGDGTATLKEI